MNVETINIHSWMLDELNLVTKNEILAFAVIYQNSKCGSLNITLTEFADILKTSKSRMCKTLNSLVEKNFIKKSEYYVDKIKYCSYSVNKSYVKD